MKKWGDIWNFTKNARIINALKDIENRLISGNINASIKTNGREYRLKNESMLKIISTYYRPQLLHAYKWILAIGIVPWYIGHIKEINEYVPIVPSYKSGKIKSGYNKDSGLTEFIWENNIGFSLPKYSRKGNKIVNKFNQSMYFFKTKYSPDMYGEIQSILTPYAYEWNKIEELKRKREERENMKQNVPIMIQSNLNPNLQKEILDSKGQKILDGGSGIDSSTTNQPNTNYSNINTSFDDTAAPDFQQHSMLLMVNKGLSNIDGNGKTVHSIKNFYATQKISNINNVYEIKNIANANSLKAYDIPLFKTATQLTIPNFGIDIDSMEKEFKSNLNNALNVISTEMFFGKTGVNTIAIQNRNSVGTLATSSILEELLEVWFWEIYGKMIPGIMEQVIYDYISRTKLKYLNLFDEEEIKNNILKKKNGNINSSSVIFESINQLVSEENKIIKEKETKNEKEDKNIEKKDKNVKKKDENIEKKDEDVKKKDENIEKKDEDIKKKDEDIKKKDEDVKKKDEDVKKEDEDVKKKDGNTIKLYDGDFKDLYLEEVKKTGKKISELIRKDIERAYKVASELFSFSKIKFEISKTNSTLAPDPIVLKQLFNEGRIDPNDFAKIYGNVFGVPVKPLDPINAQENYAMVQGMRKLEGKHDKLNSVEEQKNKRKRTMNDYLENSKPTKVPKMTGSVIKDSKTINNVEKNIEK